MALYNYFSKLGTVNYNNDVVNNIISSIRFKEIDQKFKLIYYPYVIQEGERPDIIAANYYGDERYAWLVYLSNQTVDPYYQWPLTVKEFGDFITKKYGSISEAQGKIAFYRNNWYSDDSILTTSAYDALASNLKKYWNPILGYNGSITSYERKKEDWVLETNQVVDVVLSSTSGLTIDDKVVQRTSGIVTATGTVAYVDSTKVTIKHITGAFAVTAGNVGNLTTNDNSISRSVTSTSIVNTAIPISEISYWESVSYFNYEDELNESRKTIQLVDKQYLDEIEDQMIELLT